MKSVSRSVDKVEKLICLFRMNKVVHFFGDIARKISHNLLLSVTTKDGLTLMNEPSLGSTDRQTQTNKS